MHTIGADGIDQPFTVGDVVGRTARGDDRLLSLGKGSGNVHGLFG